MPLNRKTKFLLVARSLIVGVSLFLAAATAGLAQIRSATPPLPQPTPQDREEKVDFNTRESEMRTRLILKAEKKAYEEHVARAKEARQIAAYLKGAYEARQSLNPDDRKRLERLEKLSRRIRNEAGGSDTDADPKDLPPTINQALEALAEMTEELCKEVEKTPRRVVSTTIIGQANKLIGVIGYVRNLTR